MDISFEPAKVRLIIELTPAEAEQIVVDMLAPPEAIVSKVSEITNKLFNCFETISKMSTEAVINEMNSEIEISNSDRPPGSLPWERPGQKGDSRP